MDKQQIMARLMALPDEIAKAEEAVLHANMRLGTAKEVLQQKEDDLLLGNVIDGKNAEIRAAQMRQHTQNEREALADAELNLRHAAARLNKAREELRALQAVADLLKGAA